MHDLDIWRSANLPINRHGDQAEFVAAGKVDDMIARGDAAGEITWKSIRDAIRQLRAAGSYTDHQRSPAWMVNPYSEDLRSRVISAVEEDERPDQRIINVAVVILRDSMDAAAMTDSGAFGSSPQRVEDLRTSQRKMSFLLGKIAYEGGAYSFDCTIRNISQSGARIGIPDGQIVPKQVYLIDMRGGVAYASEVKWRAASQLGLLFTGSFSLDGQLPEETRYLKRLWAGSFNGSNPDAKAVRRADVPIQHSTEAPVPPIRQAVARSEISPQMIGAGIAAYAAWKPEEFAWLHSEQDMVSSVFLAMLRAMRNGG